MSERGDDVERDWRPGRRFTGEPRVTRSRGEALETRESKPTRFPPGRTTLTEALDPQHTLDHYSSTPDKSGAAPIQKAPELKKARKEYVPFKIAVTRPMTGEEFKRVANLQMFGTEVRGSVWHNVKSSYGPSDSPVEVLFEVALVRRMRRVATAAKGIDTAVKANE